MLTRLGGFPDGFKWLTPTYSLSCFNITCSTCEHNYSLQCEKHTACTVSCCVNLSVNVWCKGQVMTQGCPGHSQTFLQGHSWNSSALLIFSTFSCFFFFSSVLSSLHSYASFLQFIKLALYLSQHKVYHLLTIRRFYHCSFLWLWHYLKP